MNMQPHWPLTLYYDGDCPLCAREIQLLRKRASAERLSLVDISREDFQAETTGYSKEILQNRLHARFADGEWVTGLDATLWSWRAAGLDRWAAPLTWPALRPVLELGYRLFCRLRPHLTWLPHPDAGQRCTDNQCNSKDPR
ncbi:thiol-disulfide oxidoreductase DCC family protein [Pseudomonas sp. MIL19]|uniref:thiol-disulfide oxidoreductase DCC family protein n=1 Tax=Pseudomonas sp. MIL19 TaxID=2976979 RepID=UPI003FD19DC8